MILALKHVKKTFLHVANFYFYIHFYSSAIIIIFYYSTHNSWWKGMWVYVNTIYIYSFNMYESHVWQCNWCLCISCVVTYWRKRCPMWPFGIVTLLWLLVNRHDHALNLTTISPISLLQNQDVEQDHTVWPYLQRHSQFLLCNSISCRSNWVLVAAWKHCNSLIPQIGATL